MQVDNAYQNLNQGSSESRERSQIMIDNFRKILVDDLKESVGGYFYKR